VEEEDYSEAVPREARPGRAAQMDDDKMFMDESAFERTAARYTGAVDSKQ